MYDIERTDYGIRITIRGRLDPETAESYATELRETVQSVPEPFHIFADLRDMPTISPELTDTIAQLMEFSDENGLERSVSVVDTTVGSMQMERLKSAAGINERVINAGARDDWEDAALAWLTEGIEP